MGNKSAIIALALLSLLLAAGLASAQVKVDPKHAAMGTVFYVDDPVGRNTVTFNSKAPLEDIVGTSNQIKGYVVFDPADAVKGGAGAFSVPVTSLDTGIPMRNDHLAGEGWLNAAAHPDIVFRFDRTKDVKEVKKTGEFQTYDATLVGMLELNGRSKEIEVPVRFTYMVESEKTKPRLPGNLLAGRANFAVTLADFGISGPAGMDLIGTKVSDSILIEVSFVATSQVPE